MGNHAARRYDRTELRLRAEVASFGRALECRLVNISAGGAKLRLAIGDSLPEGARVELVLDSFGRFPATVIWSVAEHLGLQFLVPSEEMAETVMGLAVYAHRHDR